MQTGAKITKGFLLALQSKAVNLFVFLHSMSFNHNQPSFKGAKLKAK